MAILAEAPSPALTTRDVAELLGVHRSTVKRWFGGARGSAATGGRGSATPTGRGRSDGGEPEASTTPGGHRRIPLEVALRVASERGRRIHLHGFGLDAARVWRATRTLDGGDPVAAQRLLLDWLKAGRTSLIGRFLRHLTGLASPDESPRRRERNVAGGGRPPPVDPAILDGVLGGFMQRVGDGWARGNLPIRAERAASREVADTIHALLDRDRREEGAAAGVSPTAIVATVEPDQHVLGSLLVRLLLRQRGWSVEHLGTGLPVAEIVSAQRALGASLVCVSFTPPRGPPDVRRLVDVAGRLADPGRPYALALGGGGVRDVDLCGCAWPFSPPAVLTTLRDFARWLDRHPPTQNPMVASHA